MLGDFTTLQYALEESIVDYLIANVDPLQTTASYYTGMGNVDELVAPAVVVASELGNETYPFSNVYDLTLGITIKEMAADMSGSSLNSGTNPGLGVLGANIYNVVCNPDLKSGINLNNQRNFTSLFIQKTDIKHSRNGDAIISDIMLRVIGALSGSL